MFVWGEVMLTNWLKLTVVYQFLNMIKKKLRNKQTKSEKQNIRQLHEQQKEW